jgi:hypothetical protein
MQVYQVVDLLQDEAIRAKDIGRNKIYMMNLSIEDASGGDVIELLTKYFNNKNVAIDIHKCNVRNQYDIILFW